MAQLLQSHRRWDALKRRTVTASMDQDSFVSQQFWYEEDVAVVWWDFDLMHNSIRAAFQERTQCYRKTKLMTALRERAGLDISLDNDQLPFILRESRSDAVTELTAMANLLWNLELFMCVD